MRGLVSSIVIAVLVLGTLPPALAADDFPQTKLIWTEGDALFVTGVSKDATDIVQGRQLAINDALVQLVDYIALEITSAYQETRGPSGVQIRDEVRIHSQGRLQGVEVSDTRIDRVTSNNTTRYAVTVVIKLPMSQLVAERKRIQAEQVALDREEFERKQRERRELEVQEKLERSRAALTLQVEQSTKEERIAREINRIGTPTTIPWNVSLFPSVGFDQTTWVNGVRYRRTYGPLNSAGGWILLAGLATSALSIYSHTNKTYAQTAGISYEVGTTTSLAVDTTMLGTGLVLMIGGGLGYAMPQWNILARVNE